LIERRLAEGEGRLSLRDLMIEFRSGYLGEKLLRLNVIPDVDIAFGDVAADASMMLAASNASVEAGSRATIMPSLTRTVVTRTAGMMLRRCSDVALTSASAAECRHTPNATPLPTTSAAMRNMRKVLRLAPGAILSGSAVMRPTGTTSRSSASGISGIGFRTFIISSSFEAENDCQSALRPSSICGWDARQNRAY
jgi:hypothetical protein